MTRLYPRTCHAYVQALRGGGWGEGLTRQSRQLLMYDSLHGLQHLRHGVSSGKYISPYTSCNLSIHTGHKRAACIKVTVVCSSPCGVVRLRQVSN
jgi:hypothetical protein